MILKKDPVTILRERILAAAHGEFIDIDLENYKIKVANSVVIEKTTGIRSLRYEITDEIPVHYIEALTENMDEIFKQIDDAVAKAQEEKHTENFTRREVLKKLKKKLGLKG